MSDLDKAKQDLDDAITNVARAAQTVASESEYKILSGETCYLVDTNDMNELKDALQVWKEATQNFLSEAKKAGG